MWIALLMASVVADADPSPSPSPSPHGIALSVSGSNVFINQSTGGPGTTPPEGPGFAAGSPLSPMSPYDWFNAAPTVPGVTGVAQYAVTATYDTPAIKMQATAGLAFVTGSVTNAAYWSEPLLPNVDIHDLSRAIPYAIAFPTHAGQDDATVFNANVLSGSIGAPDDSWRLRGGYFDLQQGDRFVFAPPPLTNVTPSLGEQTAETLGPGMPSIDGWPSSPTSLPLLGIDAYAKRDGLSFEFSDALLPALAGTSARLVMGSVVSDRGDAGRYSFQVASVAISGNPIETTTTFGIDPNVAFTPQGALSTSTLGNQSETIAGGRAFFHPAKNYDALIEIGESWYDAGISAHPGTALPGWYEHASLARHMGDDAVSLDFYRFDARYADVILPYGIAENIWSVAWSWPGVWLKSTYQLVDNTIAGANREGFRLHFDHPGKTVEAHATLATYRQIAPNVIGNATQDGFVDGFFLVQGNRFGTIGTDRQVGLYAAWHLAHDDVVFDGVDDFLYRPALPGHSIDIVNVRTPEAVLSVQHHFSKRLIAAVGYGRYEASGQWATTPVYGVWGIGFGGVQFATGPHAALLIEARRYGLTGLPSVPNGVAPTMTGTAFVVDQRITI